MLRQHSLLCPPPDPVSFSALLPSQTLYAAPSASPLPDIAASGFFQASLPTDILLRKSRAPTACSSPSRRADSRCHSFLWVKIVVEDGPSTDGVGELCVRSPSLFKEYWRQPKVTKESFIDDGFFKTGDTVTVDEDGYHVILGRSNADIMKVGGYKLSALEIEAVLLEHPAVSECCVVGLQDNDYGEIVSAIIIINEDLKKTVDGQLKPAITLEELQEWAKEKLAPYKIPTKLFIWDTLPRNAMGKVNKKEIRRLLEN